MLLYVILCGIWIQLNLCSQRFLSLRGFSFLPCHSIRTVLLPSLGCDWSFVLVFPVYFFYKMLLSSLPLRPKKSVFIKDLQIKLHYEPAPSRLELQQTSTAEYISLSALGLFDGVLDTFYSFICWISHCVHHSGQQTCLLINRAVMLFFSGG